MLLSGCSFSYCSNTSLLFGNCLILICTSLSVRLLLLLFFDIFLVSSFSFLSSPLDFVLSFMDSFIHITVYTYSKGLIGCVASSTCLVTWISFFWSKGTKHGDTYIGQAGPDRRERHAWHSVWKGKKEKAGLWRNIWAIRLGGAF